MSVFPNNVGGFSGFNEEEVVSHELFLSWESLSGESEISFVFLGNNTTIFFFEGDEGITWSGQFVEFLILKLGNLSFYFSHLVVSLIHDVTTSIFEEVNEFSIVESENDISNFNLRDLDAVCVLTSSFHFEEFVG